MNAQSSATTVPAGTTTASSGVGAPPRRDVQPKTNRGRWVILSYSRIRTRWDRWCAFRTLAAATDYSIGKFHPDTMVRAVRVSREGRITRVANPMAVQS